MTAVGLLLVGVGILLVWSAWVDKDPRDVIREAVT